jgi:hypothetical protein
MFPALRKINETEPTRRLSQHVWLTTLPRVFQLRVGIYQCCQQIEICQVQGMRTLRVASAQESRGDERVQVMT